MRISLLLALGAVGLVAACGPERDRSPPDDEPGAIDSGRPPTDGGPVETDGGPVETDGGPDETDGGPPPTDGGPGPTDAGTSDGGSSQVPWPFGPGACSPGKPASLPGPGKVDPETLCARQDNMSGHVALEYGELGYGSIGLVDATNEYPDYDYFDVDAEGGDLARVTVRALPGQDFQPAFSAMLDGASIIHYAGPLDSDVHVATIELYMPQYAFTIDLMIHDARAQEPPTYGAGARAVYSVKVEKITKAPVPTPFSTTRVDDFTERGVLTVSEVTLPAQPGQVRISALAQARLGGAPPSDCMTLMWLVRPFDGREMEDDAHHSSLDSKISFDYDPTDPSTPPGKYLVIVDHEYCGSKTQYDFVASFQGPPLNDTCAGAVDATPTGTATRTTGGDTRYAAGTFELAPGAVSWTCQPMIVDQAFSRTRLAGRDVVFVVAVPPGKTLTARVTPGSPSWNPALWLSSTCATAVEDECVTFTDGASTGAAETLTWANGDAVARSIFIHVDAQSSTGAGPFTLDTTLAAGPGAPANDACAGALALLATGTAQSVTGTTATATDTARPSGTALPLVCQDTGGAWAGRDVVYSVKVPAGKRLKATVTAGPPAWNAAMWLSTDCASAATCLAAQDGPASPDTLAWENRGVSERTVFLHVDAAEAFGGGPFILVVSLDTPSGKDACPGSSASPTYNFLASPKYDVNDYSFSSSLVAPACRSAFTAGEPWLGRDHVYRYVVPAGKRLSITVKSPIALNGVPADAWTALLSTACGDVLTAGAGCVSATSYGSVAWTNATGAEATIFLFIDTETNALPETDYNVLPSLQ